MCIPTGEYVALDKDWNSHKLTFVLLRFILNRQLSVIVNICPVGLGQGCQKCS